jgi:hypothetical protein
MIDNELNTLIGKILRIDIRERDAPLYGKLIEVTPFWITIERKDGRHRIISKARITGIEPVRDQQC